MGGTAPTAAPGRPNIAELEDEVDKLRNEFVVERMVKDVLKKVPAYFARDSLPGIATLKALLMQRDSEVLQLRSTVTTLEHALSVRTLEIEQLKLKIARLKRMHFGRGQYWVGANTGRTTWPVSARWSTPVSCKRQSSRSRNKRKTSLPRKPCQPTGRRRSVARRIGAFLRNVMFYATTTGHKIS